jgi:class 3 adenylate cyclase
MLLDFADAEGVPPQNPAVLRKQAHGLLGTALRGLPQDSRLAVESGSAAVVCFVGDPEDALHAALLLRDQVLHRYSGQLAVRVALNMGTVDVAVDPGDQLRVTGEAIQHATQIKDLARPNEVLASRSYHHLLSHLNPDRAGRFVDQVPGDPQSAKLYAAPSAAAGVRPQPAPPRDMTGPAPLFQGSSLDDLVVQEIQHELADHIGPMASALVRKVGRRATSAQGCATRWPQRSRTRSRAGRSSWRHRRSPQRRRRATSLRRPGASPTPIPRATSISPRSNWRSSNTRCAASSDRWRSR